MYLTKYKIIVALQVMTIKELVILRKQMLSHIHFDGVVKNIQ